ncbi:MAG: TatD family hydrolase, partial [Chloroflexota bacterium]
MIIDSHAHLDFPAFVPDREMVLARARQQGVAAIINVGINMAANRLSLALAGAHAGVYAAVGVHPNEAGRMPDDDWGGLAEMAAGARVVAIGETGLDFYRRGASPEQQMAAFRRQLDLAAELGRPVIIHGRQADKEVLETLTSWVAATPAPAG